MIFFLINNLLKEIFSNILILIINLVYLTIVKQNNYLFTLSITISKAYLMSLMSYYNSQSSKFNGLTNIFE